MDIKSVSLNKRKHEYLSCQNFILLFLSYLTILVAFPRPLSLLMFLNLAIYLANIFLGQTHAKSLELKLNLLDQKALNQNPTNFLEGCCIYLLNHLPVKDQVLRDARYLQFSLKEKKSALNAFS